MIASQAAAEAAQPLQTPDAEYPLLYRNLLAVTLLGAMYQAREEIDRSRKAVERTLADPRMFQVYLAMAQAIGGDASEACVAMGRYLERYPGDEKAQIALAMAMLLGGDESWRDVLKGLLASTSDQHVREAANGLLEAY